MITRKTTDKLTLMALLTRIRLKAVLTALFAAASTAASVAVAQVNCVTVTTFNDEAATKTAAAVAVAQTYYDGLGRLTHSISRGFGGDGEDVWQRTDYDRRGNLYRRWCRTPLTAGIELPTAQMFERAAEAFYGEGQYPYTRTMYEGNTTNRPTYVYGPGEAWQRHPEQYDYGTNDSTGQGAVRVLMLNGSHLVCRGMYRRGTLRRVTYTDADGVSITTRDPLAAKHPEHSPYLFCDANPITYVDPDGLDIHRYDEAGNYIETISNSEGVDTIQIGRYSDIGFVSVADQALSGNGVFKRLFETTLTDKDGTHNLSFMTIRGDEDAFNVFKLFADLTGVEWTLVQTGTPGKNGKNYLCTSRDKDANVATSLLYSQMLLYGYTLRSHIHNHPGGTELPSGIPGHTMPSKGAGDLGLSRQIKEYTKQNPHFYIYISGRDLIPY